MLFASQHRFTLIVRENFSLQAHWTQLFSILKTVYLYIYIEQENTLNELSYVNFSFQNPKSILIFNKSNTMQILASRRRRGEYRIKMIHAFLSIPPDRFGRF
jgi:hypothetical protein